MKFNHYRNSAPVVRTDRLCLFKKLLVASIFAMNCSVGVAYAAVRTAPMAESAINLPGGTPIKVHLDRPLGSDISKTSDVFGFVVTEPVMIGNRIVIALGAVGQGIVELAGRAGGGGHEGNLTLHFQSVVGIDGRAIQVDDIEQFGGAKRKLEAAAASTAVNYVPIPIPGVNAIAGFFARRSIRGGSIVVQPETIIKTRTSADAAVLINSDGKAPDLPTVARPSVKDASSRGAPLTGS